jgi:hypothetical protein
MGEANQKAQEIHQRAGRVDLQLQVSAPPCFRSFSIANPGIWAIMGPARARLWRDWHSERTARS